MAQGYVKSLNLLESGPDSDAAIFENIGGAGITNDIRLFSGNLRKESKLLSSEYQVVNNRVIVTGDGCVPFANRNIVMHNNVYYTVFNSDGLTSFQLKDSGGNVFAPTGDITRSDAIYFENLRNMSVSRLETIRDTGSGVTSGALGINDESGIYDLRTIVSNYGIIEEGMGIFYYKKSRIPLTYADSVFSRKLTFKGNIRITNDSNETQSTTSPGLFIKGPGGSVRAFSDTSNPWTEVGTGNGDSTSKLVTTANHSSVYDLVLNDPNLIVPTAIIHSESGNVNNYTHKMKVSVNGETFYALLIKQ